MLLQPQDIVYVAGFFTPLFALTAISTAVSTGLGIAGALKKPPKPPPIAPFVPSGNDAAQRALEGRGRRQGRRSTILAGAATAGLVDDEDPLGAGEG